MKVLIQYIDGTCDYTEIDDELVDWTEIAEKMSEETFLTTKSGVFRANTIRSVATLAND